LKKAFVNSINAGQVIDDVFVARDKQIAFKKDGDPYLTLSLVDRSGAAAKSRRWHGIMLRLSAKALLPETMSRSKETRLSTEALYNSWSNT
jgi:hypothetical protein